MQACCVLEHPSPGVLTPLTMYVCMYVNPAKMFLHIQV